MIYTARVLSCKGLAGLAVVLDGVHYRSLRRYHSHTVEFKKKECHFGRVEIFYRCLGNGQVMRKWRTKTVGIIHQASWTVVGQQIPSFEETYKVCVKNKMNTIQKEDTHPLCGLFEDAMSQHSEKMTYLYSSTNGRDLWKTLKCLKY